MIWTYLVDCKVNYLSIILGVQILCEGSVFDQFLFCISMCLICRYVDIFQGLETQCDLSKLCNQILWMDVFHLNLWRIDQIHSLFLSRLRIHNRCIWNMLMIYVFSLKIFVENFVTNALRVIAILFYDDYHCHNLKKYFRLTQ